MQEKKTLLRKEDRKERRTVESYYCAHCSCDCHYDERYCNPCDSVPSTAYLSRITTINNSRAKSAFDVNKNGLAI